MFRSFRKKSDTADVVGTDASAPAATTADAAPQGQQAEPAKKSLYGRFKSAQRGRSHEISDENLRKYTGKTRAEIEDWADGRPGVAGNQPAGKINMGPTSGLGGMEAGFGFGGWGPGGDKMKFPPDSKKAQEAAKAAAEKPESESNTE